MPAPLFGCKRPPGEGGGDEERNPIAMSEMNALDIARRMAELNRPEDACRAYTLALAQEQLPEDTLEAALYILQAGGDYKVSYTALRSLYDRDCFRQEVLAVLTGAFYEPNVKLLKNRYEKNCKLLQKYPYLFRRDFPAFETLPLRFYPYDDNGYIPFDIEKAQFGDYVNFSHPVISRNFFHNLENPILATDVFSQYELEYLNDNVRPSEWVGRENHIYLHYADWTIFCAHLQVLNLRALLADKKIVFLIGDELAQYPIDFKARFGIDYGQYPVKPLGITEVNRLIWHTQLATHNGGDFFNEIFDGHPNLIAVPSVLFGDTIQHVDKIRRMIYAKKGVVSIELGDGDEEKMKRLVNELNEMSAPTEKDVFVTWFLCMADLRSLRPDARIAPAVFFQPHFTNIHYQLTVDDYGRAVLDSEQYHAIRDSAVFRAFKYIKTFTPIRRLTTSVGASVRFMYNNVLERQKENEARIMPDLMAQRILNRGFMIDTQDRLFKDSTLVRFEDGKLNPKATFTALAAFLDIPYTESLTYCSYNGERDPESLDGNELGFSTAAIYRTYDDYMGVPERYFLEYFLRDVYEYCGYAFQYYDSAPMDLERARDLIWHMDVLNSYYKKATQIMADIIGLRTEDGQRVEGALLEIATQHMIKETIENLNNNRLHIAEYLLRGLRFVNKNGQPLRMMPRLQLDPALLEQPLYH